MIAVLSKILTNNERYIHKILLIYTYEIEKRGKYIDL